MTCEVVIFLEDKSIVLSGWYLVVQGRNRDRCGVLKICQDSPDLWSIARVHNNSRCTIKGLTIKLTCPVIVETERVTLLQQLRTGVNLVRHLWGVLSLPKHDEYEANKKKKARRTRTKREAKDKSRMRLNTPWVKEAGVSESSMCIHVEQNEPGIPMDRRGSSTWQSGLRQRSPQTKVFLFLSKQLRSLFIFIFLFLFFLLFEIPGSPTHRNERRSLSVLHGVSLWWECFVLRASLLDSSYFSSISVSLLFILFSYSQASNGTLVRCSPN